MFSITESIDNGIEILDKTYNKLEDIKNECDKNDNITIIFNNGIFKPNYQIEIISQEKLKQYYSILYLQIDTLRNYFIEIKNKFNAYRTLEIDYSIFYKFNYVIHDFHQDIFHKNPSNKNKNASFISDTNMNNTFESAYQTVSRPVRINYSNIRFFESSSRDDSDMVPDTMRLNMMENHLQHLQNKQRDSTNEECDLNERPGRIKELSTKLENRATSNLQLSMPLISERSHIFYFLEECESALNKLINNFPMLAKNEKIDFLHLIQPSLDTNSKKDTFNLIEFIQNNTFIKRIKITATKFDLKFLKTNGFIEAIKSSPNLYGIEFVASILTNNCKDAEKYIIKFKSNLGQIDEKIFFYFRLAIGNKNYFFTKLNSDEIILTELNTYENSSIEAIFNSQQKTKLPDLILSVESNKDFLKNIIEDWYPLDFAVWKDDLLSIKFLIHQEPICPASNKTETTLHKAAQFASLPTLLFLLNQTNLIDCIEYQNLSGNTPLLIAAENGNAECVEAFITKYNANINHKNLVNITALELSFEKKKFNIVKILLENNAEISPSLRSKFKNILQDQDHPLYNFLKIRNNLHEAINTGDLDIVKNILHDNKLDINYCLDFNNSSPLNNSLISKQFDIYGYLISIGANFTKTEENNNIYYHLDKKEKIKLEQSVLKFIKRYDDAIAMHLYAVTRTRNSNNKMQSHNIQIIYSDFLKNELLKPVLEAIEYCNPRLEVLIDFDTKSVSSFAPSASHIVMGLCDNIKSRIYIGANDSVEEMKGTIMHEFTHQVCTIIFKNSAYPYEANDHIIKNKFEKIHNDLKIKFKSGINIDDIITRVFTSYKEELQFAELIVRVPHILAKYGNKKGIEILQNQAPELLKFYQSDFLTACNKFVENEKIKSSSTISSAYNFLKQSIKIREEKDETQIFKQYTLPITAILTIGIGYGAYRFFKSCKSKFPISDISFGVTDYFCSNIKKNDLM